MTTHFLGFLIDTETINRIKANADISTYSFRIYSLFGNPQDVYNIVYRKRNDGTLHYSIIRIIGDTPYVLYDSEAASVAQKHSHKNAFAKTSNYEDCLASYSVSVWHCKNGSSWDACDKCESCLETLTVCVGSGGGDNSGGFGGQNNGNPSNPPPPVDPITEGGSAVYLTDPSGYVFDPNLPPSTDAGYVRALRAYLFWEQLPGALYRQWANEHVDIYQNIIESYLNHYSTANNTENLNFHNEAVQYFMDHPNAAWEEFYNQYLSADSPCEKTKKMLNRSNVKTGINNVKAQALNTLSNINAGEIGFKEKKDGTIVPANVNASHHVIFSDVTDGYGGYHNHTATGTHMFSPPDIETLFGFAAAQSIQDGVGNAYFGMIAAEWCNCPPSNQQFINYVITYTGTGAELGGYVYTPAQMKQFEKDYQKKVDKLLKNPLYSSNNGAKLNQIGLEKLYFDTLKNMGLGGKVNLQRVEPNGTVYNVNEDSNGMPVGIPCP
ncbi:hypothetical protein [Chryseobacterium takakiae]|uniref:Uncharacterized protein n=1 Tax=Chryseobacterium takakiae TaxID=1302685 RepID=A0A1M4XMJ1_9FLAO|nr:hypothetical protein [Chryseobacterium takakiae]SHE94709.1 hypothetical protein SAMN05444408_106145 [Chryseobacterium takakiae]